MIINQINEEDYEFNEYLIASLHFEWNIYVRA